jgi:acyl carrier protein
MTNADVLSTLREILERDFKIPADKVTPEATFRGTLGMDSLDVVDLIFFLEKAFALNAGLEAYRELHSVRKLCDFVVARKSA